MPISGVCNGHYHLQLVEQFIKGPSSPSLEPYFNYLRLAEEPFDVHFRCVDHSGKVADICEDLVTKKLNVLESNAVDGI